ncbi:hypothetical protein CH64_3191 [Yersinia rohdei]|uniref:Uncharacterized protein n=1 Tax=Yersinia rohdei TaxID=29485 RepID=A0ABM5S9T5_YERRO|nr:hypothetical protein CH64_3191 [Yersinia rohdei]CNI96346.1 Uncharacterised protein [Yersinia rohdei]
MRVNLAGTYKDRASEKNDSQNKTKAEISLLSRSYLRDILVRIINESGH